jgi:hypothetical protein
MAQKPDGSGGNTERSGDKHDWRKRPAINGGAFHQCPDGLEIFFGPIWIHVYTLQHKA